MAFDITGLQAYVKLYPALFKTLWERESVLQYFTQHLDATSVKMLWRYLETNSALQECCKELLSNDKVFDKVLDIICITDGGEFCNEGDVATILANTEGQRFGAGKEALPATFTDVYTASKLNGMKILLNKLVFQGDTTSSNPNMARYNGLLKQSDGQGVELDLTGETNVYDIITKIVASFPAQGLLVGGGIDIFVPTQIGTLLRLALINKNLYHYAPGQTEVSAIDQPFTVPGLNGVRIIPTSGLDGTDTIFATARGNVHWFTNVAADLLTIKWGYQEHPFPGMWYWYMKFLFGLSILYPQFTVTANINLANIANADQTIVNVNLVSPNPLPIDITNDPLVVQNQA